MVKCIIKQEKDKSKNYAYLFIYSNKAVSFEGNNLLSIILEFTTIPSR